MDPSDCNIAGSCLSAPSQLKKKDQTVAVQTESFPQGAP